MHTAARQGRLFCAAVGAAACLGLAAGCATGQEACRRDPVTGAEQCAVVGSDPGQAAATAAAAAASWGAVGCTVNGCQAPFRCNPESKLCERMRCSEDVGGCPPGFSCNPNKNVCE
jgi:hypothetical protein